jgi:hypothetical protein
VGEQEQWWRGTPDGLTRIMKGPEINGSEVMKYIKKQTEREV